MISGGTLKLPPALSTTVGAVSYTSSGPYTFAPAGNNLLLGLSPAANTNTYGGQKGNGSGGSGTVPTGGVGVLTDGYISNTGVSNTDLPYVYSIGNGAQITYTLGNASANGYDLSKINIYSEWNDNGRGQISISSIAYSTVANPTVFTAIPNSGMTSAASASEYLDSLTASGGVLASRVYAIQFNFGSQENNWVGYAELEAVGTPTPAANNLLPITTPLTIAANSSFDLSGGNQQVASLSDFLSGQGGSVTNSATGTTSLLTIATGSGASSTFSGTLQNGYGTVGLTINGAGTQVLAGANTFSGPTTLSAGTLDLANQNALPNSTLNYQGGTLMFDAAANSHAFTLGGLGGSTALALQDNGGNAVALSVGNNGQNTTYSGNLSGSSGSLTKVGSGLLSLGGNNSYSGGTYINGGILNLANPAALPSGGNITFGGGTLQYSSFNTQDYSNQIVNSTGPIAIDTNGQNVNFGGALASSNSGGLLRTGGGTLTLFGASAYSGGTTFNNTGGGTTLLNSAGGPAIPGNVQIGNATAGTVYVQTAAANQFASSASISFNTSSSGFAVLELMGNSQGVATISETTAGYGVIENSQTEAGPYANSILTINSPNNSTFGGYLRNTAGAATGTIGLNITGTGGLTLSGGNISYTGSTAIPSGGTLTLVNATAFASPVTDNGTLGIFTNGSDMFNGTPGFNKVVSGTGGLVKSGVNSLGLGGANTYSGGTTVNAGRIYLYNAAALGTGTVTIGSSSSVSFWISGSPVITNNFVVNSLGMGSGGNDALFGDGGGAGGSYTLSGSITLNGPGGINATTSNPMTISGPITGTGGIVKGAYRADLGTVTLSNTNNSYQGGTVIDYGTLKQGASGVIPSGAGFGDLTVGGGTGSATFDLGGFNAPINGLWGNAAGIVTNSGAAAVLTVGNNNASSTFAGQIQSANASLAKTGSGNLTLSGVNTFTGSATVNAGTITLANSGALSGAWVPYNTGFIFAGNIGNFTLGNLGGGNNLNMVDANSTAINLSIGSSSANATYSGILSGGGSLTKIGGNSLTLTSSQAYAGTTTIAGGQLVLGGLDLLPNGQALTITGGTLNLGGLAQDVPGTLSFQGGLVSGGTVNKSVSNYDAQAGTVTASLAGNVALVKSNSGGFLLTNSGNAYSGGTQINAGTLSFANGALPGNILFGGGTLQWAAGNTQDVSAQIQPIPSGVTAGFDTQGNVVTLASPLSGTGGIARVGSAGILVLANTANSYSGGTTLSGGTLSISALADLGSGPLTFNGGVLQVTGTAMASLSGLAYNSTGFNGGFDIPAGNTFTVYDNLSGSGSLGKYDGGTLVLAGTNSLGGTTTVSGGALLYASTSAISNFRTRNLAVANGAAVGVQYPIDQYFLQQIAAASLGNSFVVALGGPSANNLDFSAATGGSLSAASLARLAARPIAACSRPMAPPIAWAEAAAC